MTIEWNILQPVDIGARFQAGLDAGTARRSAQEDRALQMMDRSRALDARSALSSYMQSQMPAGGGSNALMLPPPPVRPNALGTPSAHTPPTVAPGIPAATNALLAPPDPSATSALPNSVVAPEQPAAAPQLSERDQAFLRLIKSDPATASEVQRQEAADHHQRLQNFEALNNMGMQILAGVHDQASYDQGRAQARAMYIRYGEDPSPIDQLPAQWSPELSQQLQMQGMNTQHQVETLLQHMRLNWNIQDDQIDNAREGRATDSLIGFRQAELGQGERRLAQGEARINLERADPRRVAPGTNRAPSPASVIGGIMEKQARGEPLTPAEQRTLSDYRAPRNRRPGRAGGGEGTVIVNPTTGQRMRLQGGQWVPAG